MARYCFEIKDGPSPYNWFAYFDTEDHLADFVFSHEKVNVTIEGEYGAEGDPYRIILGRIQKEQREAFLKALDLIPALMEYVGKTDYDDFCQSFMMDVDMYMKTGKRPQDIPLQ